MYKTPGVASRIFSLPSILSSSFSWTPTFVVSQTHSQGLYFSARARLLRASSTITFTPASHRSISFFDNKGKPTLTTSTATSTSSTKMTHQKTEQEWRAILSPEQFRVLRQKGTEYPNTGIYNKHSAQGVYTCAGCNTPLYKSDTKFTSGCGWPAFFQAIPGAVGRITDADGHRIEIVCNACGGHLGHVFKGEGFDTPTDERHCVNSVSLKFSEK
jgi:peptide-methionine (R)-S-oxide reductase